MKKILQVLAILLVIGAIIQNAGCKKEDEKKLATVITLTPTNINAVSAKCGGNVTDDGNAEITVRGVIWDSSSDPTLTKNIGFSSNGSGKGEFTHTVTSLAPSCTYYVRAYATNSEGTAYGESKQFQTTL